MKVIFRLALVGLFLLVTSFSILKAQCDSGIIIGPETVCAGETITFFTQGNMDVNWQVSNESAGSSVASISVFFENPLPMDSDVVIIEAISMAGTVLGELCVTVFASPELTLTSENRNCSDEFSDVDFCLCTVNPISLELD